MGCTFADQPGYSAAHLYSECVRTGFPLDWFGKANVFKNPVGHLPGEGAVLLTRDQLDQFKVNEPQDLVFADGDTTVTLHNIHIAGSTTAVTPGGPTGAAVHFVPLADVRRRLRLAYMNVGYNLRRTPTGNYQDETTYDGAGTPWTWAQIWADLWRRLEDALAGAAPSLPSGAGYCISSGCRYPEQIAYHGWCVMDAVGDFLARLACALVCDPTKKKDPFSVVSLGADQKGFDKAWDKGTRLRDMEPVSPAYGTVPSRVLVASRKEPTRAYGNTPLVFTPVTTDKPKDGEGGDLMIWDDLRAAYQGKSRTNQADLTYRAQARATAFLRERRDWFNDPQRKVWSGARDDLTPGSKVEYVLWRDAGYAVLTEAARVPPRDPHAEWPGTSEQPWRLTEVLYVKTQPSGGAGGPADHLDAEVVRKNEYTDETEVLFDCWAWDPNGTAVPGYYAACTFQGFVQGRPVYAVSCCPDVAPGAPPGPGSGGTGDDWDDDPFPDPDPDPNPDPNRISTECCPNPISKTLYGTISAPGTALDGVVVTMAWGYYGPTAPVKMRPTCGGISATYFWYGELPVEPPCGTLDTVVVVAACFDAGRCPPSSDAQWAFDWGAFGSGLACNLTAGNPNCPADTQQCDPVALVLHDCIGTDSCNCLAGVDVTVTITE